MVYSLRSRRHSQKMLVAVQPNADTPEGVTGTYTYAIQRGRVAMMRRRLRLRLLSDRGTRAADDEQSRQRTAYVLHGLYQRLLYW